MADYSPTHWLYPPTSHESPVTNHDSRATVTSNPLRRKCACRRAASRSLATISLTISSSEISGDQPSRSRAASLSGLEVVVRRDALPSLEAGDYYWCDLQGLQVWCRDGSHSVLLGTAERLIETGANDVVVVRACAGSVDDRERLIPYLPGQTVINVDLAAGRIEVDWFLDEY